MDKPITKMSKIELLNEVEMHRFIRWAVFTRDVFSLPELSDRVSDDPIEAQKYLEQQSLYWHFIPILSFLQKNPALKVGIVPNFWFSDRTKYVVDVKNNLFVTESLNGVEEDLLRKSVKVVVDHARIKNNDNNVDIQLMSAFIDRPLVIQDSDDTLSISDKSLHDFGEKVKPYTELHLPLSSLLESIVDTPLIEVPKYIRSVHPDRIANCEQTIDRLMKAQGARNARSAGILNNLLILRKGVRFWKELWFIPIFHPDNKSISVCLFFSNSNFDKFVIPVQDCLTTIIMSASASLERKAIDVERKKMEHHVDLFERLKNLVEEFKPSMYEQQSYKFDNNLVDDMKSCSLFPNDRPRKVFISYARNDNKSQPTKHTWIDQLSNHLDPLVKQNKIKVFLDIDMEKGASWDREIKSFIESSHIAILLISSEFISSRYIMDTELPLICTLAKKKKLNVLPILVSPCRYENIPCISVHGEDDNTYSYLGDFLAVNNMNSTLSDLNLADQERVFMDVIRTIESFL